MNLLVLFLLLLPAKNFTFYLAASCIAIGLYLIIFVRLDEIATSAAAGTTIIIIIASLYFCSSWLRSLSYQTNLRDFIETGRFIPIILLTLGAHHIRSDTSFEIRKPLAYVTAINLIISVLQSLTLLGKNPLTILSTPISMFFQNPHHFKSAYLIAHRISGISTGPAQQGILCTVLACYFLINHMFSSNSKKEVKSLIFFLANVLMVLLSQSQTSFITLCIVITILISIRAFDLGLFKINYLKSATLVGIIVIVTYMLEKFYEFKYLLSLFAQGIYRSSFQKRLTKWDDIVEKIFNNTDWLFIGYGKDYFGHLSTAMDSEFLFFFSVYGLIISTLIFLIYLVLILKGYTYYKLGNKPQGLLILSVIFCAVLFSISSSFFLDPKIMLIATYFILLGHNKNLKKKAIA